MWGPVFWPTDYILQSVLLADQYINIVIDSSSNCYCVMFAGYFYPEA